MDSKSGLLPQEWFLDPKSGIFDPKSDFWAAKRSLGPKSGLFDPKSGLFDFKSVLEGPGSNFLGPQTPHCTIIQIGNFRFWGFERPSWGYERPSCGADSAV